MSRKSSDAKKRRKRRSAIIRRIAVGLLVTLFLGSVYCAMEDVDPIAAIQSVTLPLPQEQAAALAPPQEAEEKRLDVYMIDVGSGDSLLLVSPNGKTMLVDAGESTALYPVRSFLRRMGITRLDTVIATHPHSDHIGGMAGILRSFEVGEFYLPDVVSHSAAYSDMIEALNSSIVKVRHASVERTPVIEWDDDVKIEVLSPFEDISYDNINNYSVIFRASYGSTSMLFTGDAEGEGPFSAEYTALSRFTDDRFKCTVLKVGHHGSASSTTDAFLAAADPDYAVISVGSGNDYGHPHKSVLAKLENAGADVFRTDLHGTLHIALDGENAVISSVQRANLGDRFSCWWRSVLGK